MYITCYACNVIVTSKWYILGGCTSMALYSHNQMWLVDRLLGCACANEDMLHAHRSRLRTTKKPTAEWCQLWPHIFI